MCKTGRKINKIKFNKFIWLYWKMKKKYNIYFFGGFLVARMKKKKEKERKATETKLNGLPIFPV